MEKKFAPIGEIKIDMDDVSLVFDPKEDITPKEVALIFQMFLNALIHKEEKYLDFNGYLESKNLKKHFTRLVNEISDSDTIEQ